MRKHAPYRKMPAALALGIILVLIVMVYGRLDQLGHSVSKWREESNSEKPLRHRTPQFQLVRAVDGDTIVVQGGGRQERVRLIGVNAPESVDPRRPVECFGREASTHLKELVGISTELWLESDPSQGERDRYGRLLAYVFLADGTNLNEKMITDGYAYEYTYRAPHKYQAKFRAAERAAREAGRGLWHPATCGGKQ